MGAAARSIVRLRLEPGSSTLVLRHEGEAVYFVGSGHGAVLAEEPEGAPGNPNGTRDVREGFVIHVGAGCAYRLRASQSTPLELLGGPCPPDPSWFEAPGSGVETPLAGASPEATTTSAGSGIQVLDSDEPALMLPIISSDARMIAWPGNGAWDATMNYVRMAPGEENTPHSHAHSEDTIVILEGRGSVDDLSTGRTLEFTAGDVIHVPAQVRHAVRANRGSSVVSVGGPCPADVAFLRSCGADLPERAAR